MRQRLMRRDYRVDRNVARNSVAPDQSITRDWSTGIALNRGTLPGGWLPGAAPRACAFNGRAEAVLGLVVT
jgi:hypothetical protein